MSLEQRACFVKLDKGKGSRWEVPFMEEFYVTKEDVREHELELYEKQEARSAEEVDRLLDESEKEFVRKANGALKEDGPFDGDKPPRKRLTKKP